MEHSHLQSHILDWLHHHHQWVAITIFAVSLLESLAVVGLIVPGVFILFAAAAIAGSGALPLWVALLMAFIGAVIGDAMSFSLGCYGKEHIHKWWPFSRYPAWLNRTEIFFLKHGGKSVIIGRFVGPFRPFIPMVAGIFRMPAWKFYTINILSAMVWAPAYILPGFFTGATLNSPHADLKPLLYLLTALIVCSSLVSYSLCELNRFLGTKKTWQQIMLWLPMLALITLSLAVFFGYFSDINAHFNNWLTPFHLPWVLSTAQAISALADGMNKILLFIPLCALLWYVRLRLNALIIIIAFTVHAVLVGLMKALIALPRPIEAGITGSLYAFPSGHMSSVSLWAMLFALFTSYGRRVHYQAINWSIALVVISLMGLSRLLLGDHWLSDVLGGFFVGALVTALSHRFLCQKPVSRLLLLGAFAAGLILAWLANLV